jgi:hypothetical protein
MTDCLVLHPDKRPEIALRSRIFGHPGSMFSFREEYVAKIALHQEFSFYWNHSNLIKSIFPENLIPKFAGFSCLTSNDILSLSSPECQVHFKLRAKSFEKKFYFFAISLVVLPNFVSWASNLAAELGNSGLHMRRPLTIVSSVQFPQFILSVSRFGQRSGDHKIPIDGLVTEE